MIAKRMIVMAGGLIALLAGFWLPAPARACIPDLGRVCIVVDPALYPSISTALARYQHDLQQQGFKAVIYGYSGGGAAEIRSLLAGLYAEPESLAGAVLVGNIPPARYGSSPPGIATDWYYMDLDGVWTDANSDGAFENWTGDRHLEIWVSRLKTDNLPLTGAEADLIAAYVNRDHSYRTGRLNRTPKGLVYIDALVDLAVHPDPSAYQKALEAVYGVGNGIVLKSKNSTYFKGTMMKTPYEIALVTGFGSSTYQTFYTGSFFFSSYNIYNTDYLSINPPWLVEVMTGGQVCNFTATNNLCGTYVFNPAGYGLLAIGTTNTANGTGAEVAYFDPDSIHYPMGKAFQVFVNKMVDNPAYSAGVINYIGAVMLGDGALQLNMSTFDYDDDSMPNDWEVDHSLDPEVDDAFEDPDDDGIPNGNEFFYELDPQLPEWASLTISSDPPGAEVYLDGTRNYRGRFIGLSGDADNPLVIAGLRNEKHTVTLVGKDHFVCSDQVALTHAENQFVAPELQYRNVEVFTSRSAVKVGGTAVTVPGGNSAPHAVDLNLDGAVDLLVGAGDGGVTFYPNLRADGLELGDGASLLAGNTVLNVVKNAKPFAVDWNNDNRLDLLVGNNAGQVWLFPGAGMGKFNAGSPLCLSSGSELKVPGGRAAPVTTDWDGDHRKDLLVGTGQGKILFFPNRGSDEAPELGEPASLTDRYGGDIQVVGRASLLAYDIDRDGHLDLVLGGTDGNLGFCIFQTGLPAGLECFYPLMPTTKNDVTSDINVGADAIPGFADINGDFQQDLLVGNRKGKIFYYQSHHLVGDLDRSTKVDGGDWIPLRASMGLCKGDAGYNPGADLNDDHCVSGEDESILLGNLGKTY